ncbi:MAG: hypothetical protein KDK45_16100 [Leptospiraceae bacterium]|nr:hypothetical protein [Leptospiraceae bacterium]
MKFIRPCPECGTELRFPLDRGILIIKCPTCSYQFIIDPDNPETFNKGRFDFPQKQNSEGYINKTQNLRKDFKFGFKDYFQQFRFDIKQFIVLLLFLFIALHGLKMFGFFEKFNPDRKEFEQNRRKVKEKKIKPVTEPPEYNI